MKRELTAAEIKMVAEAFRSAVCAEREADDEKLARMRAMRRQLTPREAAIVEAFRAALQELYHEIGKTERRMVDDRVEMARQFTDFYESRRLRRRWC